MKIINADLSICDNNIILTRRFFSKRSVSVYRSERKQESTKSLLTFTGFWVFGFAFLALDYITKEEGKLYKVFK